MIHIRNCVTPTYTNDNSVYRFGPWLWREVMLLGRWTEVANNGDAAWASNVIETFTDLYVNPADPMLVKKASGSFNSAHAGRILSLFDSTNDANVVMANILSVPSTNTLRVNAWNLGKPWVTASGLTGRVHIGGQTALLSPGAWTVLQAPGGGTPFQIRITCSSTENRITFDCLPKGDYAGAKTYTNSFSHDYTGYLVSLRVNADIAGELFMVWQAACKNIGWGGVTNGYWYGMAGGSLDVSEIAPTDLYPRFITECCNTFTVGWYTDYLRGFCTKLNMLDFTDTKISAYPEYRKAWSDATATDTWGLFCGGNPMSNLWKWCNGKVIIAKPWVVTEDILAGGYRRGRLPWNLANANWEDWRTANLTATSRFSPGEILLPSAGILGCDKYPPLTVF